MLVQAPVAPHFHFSPLTLSARTDVDRKCFVATASCAGVTKQRDKMCFWSTAGTPDPPGQASPDTLRNSLNRPPNYISAAPDGLANASRSHSKLRARSPLSEMSVSCENAALVPASARNRPLFTSVNSHAPAQKSSGAFFHDTGRERCRKRPGRVRIALRASAGVRARTLMLNQIARALLIATL